ncbi:MAG: DUF2796 domain-containing protein [Pseudomonadota bacterium]
MRSTTAMSLVLAALVVTGAHAQETRELDAHEHGVSLLNIAVDGDQVVINLEAPGADIVGFEYEASTAADIAAVDGALATLADPMALFVMPDAAGCVLDSTEVNLLIEGDDHDHDHDDHGDDAHAEHDDHDHDDHGDEEHAEHDDHDHDDHGDDAHAEHDDHDHDDHDHEEHADHDDHDEAAAATHSEFRADYSVTCSDVAAITSIEMGFFDAFETAGELEVTVVTDAGAQAFEVTRDAPVLELGGLF